jgi:hypothetical protein
VAIIAGLAAMWAIMYLPPYVCELVRRFRTRGGMRLEDYELMIAPLRELEDSRLRHR